MNTMKTRTAATLTTVLLLALMGCSSDSPTAPSTGGGGGGGGTNPPTSDIGITLTASNLNPLVGSSSVITARATSAGATVVDGTAIEFSTTFGTFVETAEVFALRTTASGAATVTLTSATAGTAVVTARLGAVSRTITITFRVDTGGNVGPTISSVTPNTGPPSGNQVVTIKGTNLKGPIRVFFGTKEATVVSATETEIKVVTPAVTLGASQQSLSVDVRVITEAGTPNEASVTLPNGYRYELEILTPSVTTLSPTTGPNEGNTRFTIFGEGFQSPVKVFFGAGATEVEVEVVSVSFSQILAITPPAAGLGAAFLNASVSVRVLNLASNTQVTYNNAFRYGPRIEITGFQPGLGSHLGGDRVTIFGFGFDDPVAVSIAGVPAQVIRVSGTEIIAITSALLSCDTLPSEPIIVTNLEQNGAGTNTATSTASFTYLETTKIVGVTPLPMVEGGIATITVDDPGLGAVKFTIGGKTAFPTSALPTNPFAVTPFTIVVPTGLVFGTEACTTAGGIVGTRKTVTDFDVEFTNILTGCGDTLSIPIRPLDTACVTTPTITVAPAAGAFPITNESSTSDIVFTVTNTGGVPVSGLAITGVTAPFTVQAGLGTTTLAPAASTQFTLRFSPPVVGTDTPYTATASLTSSAPAVSIPLTGTGNAPAITVAPAAGAFGTVNESATGDIVFTVTNTGGAPVSGLTVTGIAAPFSIQVGLGATSLAPSASTQFTLRFSPPVVGADTAYTGTANVNSNAPTIAVALTGTGNAP